MKKLFLFSLFIVFQSFFGQSNTLQKTVYFKPPANWNSTCVWPYVLSPQLNIDFFFPQAMTTACEGWYKYSIPFYKAEFIFNNCNYILGAPTQPGYQEVSVYAEDIIFYDFSNGLISNPPACLLAVNNASKKVAVVKIFPNPVQDYINIESDKNFTAYEIIDESGKMITHNDFKSTRIVISNLTAGVYFIKLKSLSNETNIVKFIKK